MNHTVLAIGAHFDDCPFGIPGILLKAVQKHQRVVVLNLIGNFENSPPMKGRGAALRDFSMELAHKHGIEMRFMDYASAGFEPSIEVKRAVAQVVAEVEPDTAFMLWPRDRHPDHEVASTVCHSALYLTARLVGRNQVKTPSAIFWYDNGPGHTLGFEPDTFVDVTTVWPSATDWLGRLTAFVKDEPYDAAKLEVSLEPKTVLARYRGLACGSVYAEAVKAFRPRTQEI